MLTQPELLMTKCCHIQINDISSTSSMSCLTICMIRWIDIYETLWVVHYVSYHDMITVHKKFMADNLQN